MDIAGGRWGWLQAGVCIVAHSCGAEPEKGEDWVRATYERPGAVPARPVTAPAAA
ncbi:hypothetical protein GCM10008956_02020 [Deinococcus arenae]|uniref:Uncharacterized protein n=1 Tax=Deinococcus arenae TaxID=1452751 RepID=A0A8H9L658_9DEIO|nr:hypothetical protein GCM10008956_02020 [Deinococcus arenae]